MAEGARLRTEGLALDFGGLNVLRGVSIEAMPGELFALIGPNGAGKTSVLNCVSGIYRPGRGQVLLGERDITALPPHEVAEAGVARTFQHGEVLPQMSVLENLLLGRHRLVRRSLLREGWYWGGIRRQEIEQRHRVEEILDFIEMERYRGEPAGSLPFGLQKLVGVGRALAMEPTLLLLDEPSAGLNREEKEHLARFLLRIKHELGITMIWVEHDMQMVADLADSIHVLSYGETMMRGTPAEVLADERVLEAYLGRPAL
ncbi:MAG: ABC transporter ATP-binding protein [Stellaceae bacterium]